MTSSHCFHYKICLKFNARSIAQSICTHYSILSGRPDIFLGSGTFLRKVQNMGCKKPGLFSFWITMTLFFTSCFLQPIFWTWFFSGLQTDPCFQNKNSGCRLTGWMCFRTDAISITFLKITLHLHDWWHLLNNVTFLGHWTRKVVFYLLYHLFSECHGHGKTSNECHLFNMISFMTNHNSDVTLPPHDGRWR